jgi:prepilin-type N-terminal cleavage/methylation domain-containing protein
MQWEKTKTGFTIVELLIVVVVIAILAAITIVSYRGISQRANAAVAQNAVAQASKKLAVYAIDNNEVFPADLSSIGLVSGRGITYQYTVNNSTNPKGYCVTASSNGYAYYRPSNFTYTSSATTTINEATPITGACPGHSPTGTTVTNLSLNPSAEVNSFGYAGPNGSTAVRSTTRAYNGSASILGTMPSNAAVSTVGVSVFSIAALTGYLEPNTTYTVSMYVYAPAGTVDPTISVQGSGRAESTNPTERTTNLKDQWVRLQNTFTTSSGGVVVVYVLNNAPTTAAGSQCWVDAVLLQAGTTMTGYADGNSAGWVWSGASANSTSVGPSL